MVFQTILFFTLLIALDWRKTNSFKSYESNKPDPKKNILREKLPKSYKVLQHEESTRKDFEKWSSSFIKVKNIEKVYKDGL